MPDIDRFQKFAYTPPEIAAMLEIAHEKVLTWIRTGELRSRNLRTAKGGQRPRYFVLHEDLKRFLDDRAVKQPPQTVRTPHRRSAPDDMY